MLPDRWKRIEDVFQKALQRTNGVRTRFLDRVCAGAPLLRAEVESLLAAEADAERLLDVTRRGPVIDLPETRTRSTPARTSIRSA